MEKVKNCIDIFFEKNRRYPKPSEIFEVFLKTYGFPKQKDFTRLLRTWVEKGFLKRDEENRYFYKQTIFRTNSLTVYL